MGTVFFLYVVYFNRGTLPPKVGEKGHLAGQPRGSRKAKISPSFEPKTQPRRWVGIGLVTNHFLTGKGPHRKPGHPHAKIETKGYRLENKMNVPATVG